ncbi:hypothetical protein L6164_008765 [Bauhinia variegata]|uniref:Uncharacterized protein n=1 Tax=Bauhinia variegata TaxID=167791 RepID=A0ACB9PHG7_BAUVA|nr:hypothetical protein L6164_008765 [Bauhinia variegata]
MTTVNMDSDEKKYAPYFKAVYKGYWPAVNEFLKFHPEGVRARTSLGQGGTALHVAASLGHLHIVEELVKLMSEEDVALVDYAGYTALAVAATTGITEIAQCIIKKNKNLIFLTDLPDVFVFDDMPVTMAVENGHLEMARYLYSVTPFEKLLPERGSHGAELLNRSFVSNFFGLPQHQLAVYIFNMIGIKRIYEYKLIHELSRQLLHLTCNEIAALNIFSEMSNAFVYKSIFRAAESGIPEFITGVINAKPALLTSTDTDGRNLFFYAVKFRQAKVFSLIYGLVSKGAVVNTVDVYGNNLLHMAAELEPPTLGSSIPCAAIQMQIELQWFKVTTIFHYTDSRV